MEIESLNFVTLYYKVSDLNFNMKFTKLYLSVLKIVNLGIFMAITSISRAMALVLVRVGILSFVSDITPLALDLDL